MHVCPLGILALHQIPCSILPLTPLAVAKKLQSSILISNFPFHSYDTHSSKAEKVT